MWQEHNTTDPAYTGQVLHVHIKHENEVNSVISVMLTWLLVRADLSVPSTADLLGFSTHKSGVSVDSVCGSALLMREVRG